VALCTMCAWKGVNNLLNHTPPVAGTSGSTNQVWGLPEQDSIYGRLRRLKFPATVSTTKYSFNNNTKQGHNPCMLHIYHVTPPCQIWPVPIGTSKAGVHSWILTTCACQNLSGMHARENI